MSRSSSNLARRRFLKLAGYGAAVSTVATKGWGETTDPLTVSGTTLTSEQVRTVVDKLNGPEGPTTLADGRVAFVARPGNVLLVNGNGEVETLASELGLVVGTASDRANHVLYVCKMDPARMPRPPGAATPSNAAPPSPPSGALPGAAILKIDLASKAMSVLYAECDGKPLAGPNKIAVDRWGDLWISDVFEGTVYNARTDGSAIRRAVATLPGAHGITLSPDSETLYVSNEERVAAFSITGRGQLAMVGGSARSRVVVEYAHKWRADGIRTQANGDLVLAAWDQGLIVVSADGKPLSQIRIDGQGISNFAFGGEARRTIYATTNKAGSGAGTGPASTGELVAFDWPQAGPRDF